MASKPTEAFLNWIRSFGIFLIFGGVGAGIIALLYEAILGEPFSGVLYAVIFGGSGLIAYDTFRGALKS